MMAVTAVTAVIGALLALVASAVAMTRLRASTGQARDRLLWLVWGATVTFAAGLAAVVFNVLVDWPPQLYAGLVVGCVVMPLSVAFGRWPWANAGAARALVQTLVVVGLVLLVEAVYLMAVVGLGRLPEGHERTTLVLSIVAAAVACVLAFPARRRLDEWANQHVYGERHAPDEALRTFGSRMSRAVPLDELLLQLVETLKKTMQLDAAEIWTGSDGLLTRTVSVPDRPIVQLHLSGEELPVAARAQAQGNAWLQVWVPALLEGRDGRLVRSVTVAHLGELLGFILVERPGDANPVQRGRGPGAGRPGPPGRPGPAQRAPRLGAAGLARRAAAAQRGADRQPGAASCPRPTSRAAGSSATCTTAPSSTWWPWPSRSASRRR